MDGITILIIVLIGIGFILISKLCQDYRKRAQGREGERIVARKLKSYFGNRKSKIFNDLTLDVGGGRTTQIDHLVISQRGIFCIETKFLNGMIKGDIKQDKWLHVNGKGHKNTIYNPLKQNENHIKHVARIVDVPFESIHGYVVNVGKAQYRGDINPLFGKSPIQKGTGFIFSMWMRSKREFSQAQVDVLIQLIQACELKQGRKTNKRHLSNIKKYS